MGVTACQNDVNFKSDEFGGNLASAFDEAIRCATYDDHAAAFNPAKFTEPLRKRGDPWAVAPDSGRIAVSQQTTFSHNQKNRQRLLSRERFEPCKL
jgi:hypothetical protein